MHYHQRGTITNHIRIVVREPSIPEGHTFPTILYCTVEYIKVVMLYPAIRLLPRFHLGSRFLFTPSQNQRIYTSNPCYTRPPGFVTTLEITLLLSGDTPKESLCGSRLDSPT
jgi:hypothetical protein